MIILLLCTLLCSFNWIPRGEKTERWIINWSVPEKKLEDKCRAKPSKKEENCKQLKGS